MVYAYKRTIYQVSVYRTIGPLVSWIREEWLSVILFPPRSESMDMK